MVDVVVIGLGGVGSSVLYHLARRGIKVVGIDRFAPPHVWGSSHGQTRMIRTAYFEHPDYVPLIHRAFALWRELETAAGRPLLHQTGLLQLGPADGVIVPGVRRSAAEHSLSLENLSNSECRRRFPGISLPEDVEIVLETTAGYLDVERCIESALTLAGSHGAKVLTDDPVLEWRKDGSGFAVRTSQQTVRCGRIVIAGGAWSNKLLADIGLELKILRKTLHWFGCDDDRYRPSSGFPAFLVETAGRYFYGFPVIDERGMKAAEHSGGEQVADPSAIDRTERAEDSSDVRRFLARWLPGVRPETTAFSTCIYTMSPDEHFVVGHHPDHKEVCFAAGLSGHGFKFASVLGEILTDLSIHGDSPLPIGFLSPSRFFP